MTFFIAVDTSTGNITGLFTDSDPHGGVKPPVGSIAVSYTQADQLRGGFSNFKWVNGSLAPSDRLLDNLRSIKREYVRSVFSKDSVKDVSSIHSNYSGGYDSAIKLDAAVRFSESTGSITVVFYDVYNVAIQMSLSEAKTVVLDIAAAYQAAFARKQSAMVAIDAATTQADLDLITY